MGQMWPIGVSLLISALERSQGQEALGTVPALPLSYQVPPDLLLQSLSFLFLEGSWTRPLKGWLGEDLG